MSTSILIGICTSNDGTTIDRLLDQCFRIKKKYEGTNSDVFIKQLIVVSSGSSDETDNILDNYKQKYSDFQGYLPIIETTRKGKSDAINKIIELNTSDFIIFIPADVSVTFKSINLLIEKINKSEQIGVVSAKPIPNLRSVKSSNMRSVIEAIWCLHDETLKYTTKRKFNSHSSGELMIVRSNSIGNIPGYIINDDAYIALKAKSMGYRIEYESRSIVKIEVPKTMNDYIIQRKRVLMGHSQISVYLNQPSSNFKSLLKNNPISTFKIMKNLLKSSKYPRGLILAIMLELRIEFELLLIRISTKSIKKVNPIWKRINQAQPN